MAKLKDIKGTRIQFLDADPVEYVGAWASGGNLNQSRYSLAGAGTQTAGLVFGGYSAPSRRNETEEYNGSAWAEQDNLNTGRNELTGAGIQTAALAAGGMVPPVSNHVELYNGSSWTETTELNTARDSLGSTAVGSVNTAVFVMGGGPGSNKDLVESWNGSSWTETTELNTERYMNASAGTTTSGITMGGDSDPPRSALTEIWNGSSWTESGDLSAATSRAGASGVSSTAALLFGGETGPSPNYTAVTESFNGTSWTTVNSMSTSRYALTGTGGSAPNAVALAAGGYSTSPSGMNNTEEWAFTGLPPSTPAANYSDAIVGDLYYNSTTGQFKAIKDGGAPIGTWASGAAVNTARRYLAGVGSKTAGLIFGGGEPSTSAKTESYDGTAWTEVSDLNAAQLAMGSAGTSTSGMSALGSQSPGAQVEDWNGTSWTSNPHSLNSARQFPGGDGPSNDSALMVGGEPSPNSALTEVYDGSSWSEKGDLNDARNQLAGVGTVTAFLAVGGSPNNNSAEEFNGTSWTEVSDMSNGEPGLGATGDTTLAIAFGGGNPVIATNEAWNGTSWTEVGDLANGRNFFGSSNNSGNTSAFAAAGENDSTLITNTEEWTAADFEIKTVTTS
jgi:hypothetical protein